MAHYNHADAVNALRAVGVCRGDTIFCHSNIGFFGIPEGGSSKENACTTLFNAFFEVLGEEGTLVLPTFTYSFPKKQCFDVELSASDCGMFAEWLRVQPESIRSDDPCFSVVAVGKKAKELTENCGENSFGHESFFHRFYGVGGKICNLNYDAGSTFIHYVERELNVPYRFDKRFSGRIRKIINENTPEETCLDVECYSTIYVRYLSSEQTLAVFEPFHALAVEKKYCVSATLGRGIIHCISAKDTFELIQTTLAHRPWLLIQAGVTGIAPTLIPEE